MTESLRERCIEALRRKRFRTVEEQFDAVLDVLEESSHLVERANGELHCENCLHVKAVEDPDFDMEDGE